MTRKPRASFLSLKRAWARIADTGTQSTIFTIFESTSETQRIIIGRAVTGLDVR